MKRGFFFLTIAICGLCYEAHAQSTDALFMQAACRKLQDARAYTLEVADLMPAEDYGFRPSPAEMTFGQQLVHLSQNLGWLSSYYLNDKAQNPVGKEEFNLHQKDSIVAMVNRAYDYALRVLREFPADQLQDTVSFFAGPMNKLEIINLINDHQTHHRGQLVVYLRLKGIKPPAYVGW